MKTCSIMEGSVSGGGIGDMIINMEIWLLIAPQPRLMICHRVSDDSFHK